MLCLIVSASYVGSKGLPEIKPLYRNFSLDKTLEDLRWKSPLRHEASYCDAHDQPRSQGERENPGNEVGS